MNVSTKTKPKVSGDNALKAAVESELKRDAQRIAPRSATLQTYDTFDTTPLHPAQSPRVGEQRVSWQSSADWKRPYSAEPLSKVPDAETVLWRFLEETGDILEGLPPDAEPATKRALAKIQAFLAKPNRESTVTHEHTPGYVWEATTSTLRSKAKGFELEITSFDDPVTPGRKAVLILWHPDGVEQIVWRYSIADRFKIDLMTTPARSDQLQVTRKLTVSTQSYNDVVKPDIELTVSARKTAGSEAPSGRFGAYFKGSANDPATRRAAERVALLEWLEGQWAS